MHVRLWRARMLLQLQLHRQLLRLLFNAANRPQLRRRRVRPQVWQSELARTIATSVLPQLAKLQRPRSRLVVPQMLRRLLVLQLR